MKLSIFVCLCLILDFALAAKIHYNGKTINRESRKLFGGYRITPRFCEATKKTKNMSPGGPNICMFNHECQERDGQVVGACMDGFLFGACCNLPTEVSIGDVLSEEIESSIGNIENNVAATLKPYTAAMSEFTSNGASQITDLLQNGILPTAQDNEIVQLNSDQYFGTTGVIHSDLSDTIILNQQNNDIDPGYFVSTRPPNVDRKTTIRTNELINTPLVSISISNAPLEYTTPITEYTGSLLRPKPLKPSNIDKYILVPTINHQSMSPNKTQEFDSIVNILHMLNNTSTNRPSIFSSTKKYPNSSYVINTTTRTPELNSNKVTLLKPPSTSYIFSTTVPPRRPDVTTINKKPQSNEKPNITKIQSTTSYIYNVTPSKTTFASSSSAFSTPTKPPSTSYIYSLKPTKRPDAGTPGLSISSVSSPPPTLIVLGPITESTVIADQRPMTYQQQSVTIHRPTAIPQRKPINHVTINNHVTQNIFSTSDRPSPTVLITPKPSTLVRPQESDSVEVGTILPSSPSDNANFPPVRHPNLNMSNIASLNENDITTPIFIEDETLNSNVESFVNKIIESLQEPFQDLKQVVYNKNKTSFSTTTVSKKKPIRKQGTSTVRPITVRTTKPSINNIRTSTNRPPTTKKVITKGTTAVPTKKFTVTTLKRTKPTKTPSTTTASFIEQETESTPIDSEDYRTQCGIRPLMKTGRIVGGKGASFGEYPWQVLVRESTWLGLFTKNKCGGVLISHKYVMTAAHCQPGFLASLVAVFGEFDISGELETKRSISRNVKRVIVHRQYDAATFENDLALLELEQPVQFDAHIVPICLPRDGEDLTGRMATVTGWGRLKYGGGVPSVLQVVQVPIMENHVCQEMFRTAGHSKVILDSFLCAGYANGQKDSCEGDSGGPLVLERPDGRYQLAGTVSHGIKCAAPYLPGVYMRTQFFKPWITSITGVTSP